MDVTESLTRAAQVVESGGLVVYPTETVYGLGGDALNPEAVERVFAAKRRDRSDPVAMAVPDVETALAYVRVTDREMAFMRAFLPGPITVVLERRAAVPPILAAGGDRVGIRVPEHDLAQRLLERAGPLTTTSANVTGHSSATRAGDIDPEIQEIAGIVLDGGEGSGEASTVVDVQADEIHRRGAQAGGVAQWLEDN